MSADSQKSADRKDLAHYEGCLLGGAVGDALGASVEFLSIDEIRKTYGEKGIVDYAPAYGRKGAITDDTQMTLFTAEGMLRAHAAAAARYPKKKPDFYRHLFEAYRDWLQTQNEKPPRDKKTGLLSIPELHKRRSPGNTCISALKGGWPGTWEEPVNDSKGCGGVMRTAPVGLYVASAVRGLDPRDLLQQAFEIGCTAAAITHGHPSGFLPGGVLSALIAGIIGGMRIEEALREIFPLLEAVLDCEETVQSLMLGMSLAGDENLVPSPEAIERIGAGWVGEEALAIALYCALVSGDDFERGVILAVNHSGDSDSTGAITGNIMGALLGRDAIPERWLKDLELKAVIVRMGEEMLKIGER